MFNNERNYLNEQEKKKQKEQHENEFKNQARQPDQQNRLKDQENMRK
ncbi:hypothetical protein [Pseudobacillus wudalianchiensis]|nr:hypothetical protein [Bacillus wudalianchiensis]